MNDGQLKRRLTESCPWWTRPDSWQDRDPDLRSAADAPFEHRPDALTEIRPLGCMY